MTVETRRPPEDEFMPWQERHRLLGVDLRYSAFDADRHASVPPALHPHHELIYVERGDGVQYLGSQFVRAQSGDVFVFPTYAYHIRMDPSRATTWSLCFRSEAVDGSILPRVIPLFAARSILHTSVSEQERPRWQVRFRCLLDELNALPREDGSNGRTVLQSILLDVAELMRLAGKVDALEAVFGFIDAHYRSAISLRDVAAAVHLSPAYLTDLVRRKTGRPIQQWINQRRINAAQLLLVDTDRPITAIAKDVGFRGSTYFGRYFSKITGQTPRSWREAHRGRGSSSRESGSTWRRDFAQGVRRDYAILRLLAETCGALSDREEIENAVADATYQLFRPSLVQILKRDEAMGICTIARQRGSHLAVELPPTLDTEGALPLVLAGQTVVACDLGRSSIEFFQRLGKLEVCCLMVAPIISGSHCVGAIRVLETRPCGFSEHERSLLATIGTLAGLAIRDILTRQ